MDDDTASEDEDDTANEGAAFENIMPAKTSFKTWLLRLGSY